MFKEDGNVIHFAAPKGTLSSPFLHPSLSHFPITYHPILPQTVRHTTNVAQIVHAAVPSNTFAVYGNGEDKELTELVPGILNQLGPDSLASLRKLAESYQSLQKKEGGEEKGDDDDDIPDLVAGENFESKVE